MCVSYFTGCSKSLISASIKTHSNGDEKVYFGIPRINIVRSKKNVDNSINANCFMFC